MSLGLQSSLSLQSKQHVDVLPLGKGLPGQPGHLPHGCENRGETSAHGPKGSSPPFPWVTPRSLKGFLPRTPSPPHPQPFSVRSRSHRIPGSGPAPCPQCSPQGRVKDSPSPLPYYLVRAKIKPSKVTTWELHFKSLCDCGSHQTPGVKDRTSSNALAPFCALCVALTDSSCPG